MKRLLLALLLLGNTAAIGRAQDDASGDVWFLGYGDRSFGRPLLYEGYSLDDGRDMILGRRWSSGWRVAISGDVNHDEWPGSSGQERISLTVSHGHGIRLSCGRRFLDDGAWSADWAVSLEHAHRERDFTYLAEGWISSGDGDYAEDSLGVALAVRPGVRVWRSLHLETVLGIGFWRLERAVYPDRWDSSPTAAFEVIKRLTAFGPTGEWDLTIVYEF